MSYARRSDDNQASILTALKKVTFAVSVHRTGALGFDVLARHVTTKLPVFLEIKNPDQPPSKRRLTDNESKMAIELPLVHRKVETLDEALQAVGINPWSNRLQPGQGGPGAVQRAVDDIFDSLSPAARRAKRRGSP